MKRDSATLTWSKSTSIILVMEVVVVAQIRHQILLQAAHQAVSILCLV